jgi:small-conductance mechanosensitive channel
MGFTFSAVLAALTALAWLLHVTLGQDAGGFSAALEGLAYFLTALTGARVAEALLMSAIEARGKSGATSDLLRAMTSIVLYGAAMLLWLRYGLGFDVTNLLATSAVVSVVIGFALQPTLGNLFSGLSLELERPLRVGDFVRMGEMEGRVEALKWRSILLKSGNETWFVLPNSVLTSHAIEVIRREAPSRQLVTFNVPSHVPPGVVLSIAQNVLTSGLPMVAKEPPPSAILMGTEPESASLRYGLRLYTLALLDRSALCSNALTRLWYALSREGIEMKADPRLLIAAGDAAAIAAPPRPIQSPPRMLAILPSSIAAVGARRLFGREEIVPSGFAGFVVNGTAREELMPGETDVDVDLARLLEQTPAPDARVLIADETLATICADAVRYLGPVASLIAERYARLTDDPYLVYHAIAQSIGAAAERAQFLGHAPAHSTRHMEPGAPFGWAGLLGLEPAALRYRIVNEGAELLVIGREGLVELLKMLDPAALATLVAAEPGLKRFDRTTLAEKLRAAASAEAAA